MQLQVQVQVQVQVEVEVEVEVQMEVDLHHLDLQHQLQVAASNLRKEGRLVGCTCRCKGMAFKRKACYSHPLWYGRSDDTKNRLSTPDYWCRRYCSNLAPALEPWEECGHYCNHVAPDILQTLLQPGWQIQIVCLVNMKTQAPWQAQILALAEATLQTFRQAQTLAWVDAATVPGLGANSVT